jgi:hypothetical protein
MQMNDLAIIELALPNSNTKVGMSVSRNCFYGLRDALLWSVELLEYLSLLPLGCSFYYLHHTNRDSVLSTPHFLPSENVRSIAKVKRAIEETLFLPIAEIEKLRVQTRE